MDDRQRFKPADIVACYERHCQIETSYRKLKQSLLGAELTLRSRTIDGVYQEIWGALIAYNLIRREIASAAWEAKLDPTDISFVRAFHVIQHEMMWAAVTPAFARCRRGSTVCTLGLRSRPWKNNGGVNARVWLKLDLSVTPFDTSKCLN